MTDLAGVTPTMPSQCFSCAHWFELNAMRSCHDCGDCEIRCNSCHLSHSDVHGRDDDRCHDCGCLCMGSTPDDSAPCGCDCDTCDCAQRAYEESEG